MPRSLALPAALAAILVVACGGGDDGQAGDTAAAGADTLAQAERVAVLEGFDTPESVKYDPEQDVYFVSNIYGNPSRKDGQGYIARVAAGDSAHATTRLVEGGKAGAVLNAPKGMAIAGDTLWVADIDVLRGFHKRTGAPVATIQFPQPVHFLNDVAVGPDGALYVTDTGVQFDTVGAMSRPSLGQIFRVEGRDVSVGTADSVFNGPNGITWDEERQAFVVVSFAGPSIVSWAPGGTPRTIASGSGQYDGVEIVDGRTIVSSWKDSTIRVLEGDETVPERIVAGVAGPADIGVDTRRALLLVPLFGENRVEIWTIPGVSPPPATAPAASADTAPR